MKARKAKKSRSKTLALRRGVCYTVLILLAVVSLFPFFIMIINATRDHAQIQSGFSIVPGSSFLKNLFKFTSETKCAELNLNFQGENYPIISGMRNSLIIAVLSAAFTTYFSSMTAYGIYMYRFKGRGFFFKFILAVMMVPTQVSTLGFLDLIRIINLEDSYIPLVITSVATPVVFFYMYQSMESTLPTSIVEAARIDGCNEFLTFNSVVLPMMKPAIAVQAIFAFVSSWNNYFIPALVIRSKSLWTVPIVIAMARSADYTNFDMGIIYMLMCLAIVPLIVIYLILSRSIIAGATAGGVKE